MDIKREIINQAQSLGIDMVYFTDCEAFTNIEDYLLSRKETNRDTSFEEKDIKLRIDPKETLSNCKSIIVLGMSYNSDFEIKKYPISGGLSRYSWGEDYHKVLNNKMEELIKDLQRIVDFQYKSFVDVGPLVDRELARRSGLGYYGKNCSIINKEYGSYIFIAYILTDLELEIDEITIAEECGDCDLCVKACPTGALESPYILNPKKCISYLTQNKEVIPVGLRKKMGTQIYGCDICQNVCPKNKGIKIPNHKDFLPIITGGSIDIEELFIMSNRQFKEKYGDMAGSWRGKNILKRNAIIALGNMKEKEALSLLLKEREKANSNSIVYLDWAIEKHSK